MYLDQTQWIQYVLYLNVSGLGADTEQIHCINTEIQCIVQLGARASCLRPFEVGPTEAFDDDELVRASARDFEGAV